MTGKKLFMLGLAMVIFGGWGLEQANPTFAIRRYLSCNYMKTGPWP